MFQLLSKNINIFSIPFYIILLFVGLATFNVFYFTVDHLIAQGIAFLSIFIGFSLFRSISISYDKHLPYFLYCCFVFAFTPKDLTIFWALSFLTTNLIILIISNENDDLRQNSYFLIGCLLAFNFYLLPSSFLLLVFIIIHLCFTSDFVFKNLIQLLVGLLFISINYISLRYILNLDLVSETFIPLVSNQLVGSFYPLILLSFLGLFLVYSISDHLLSLRKKSLKSRFLYSILLMYFMTLSLQLFLYMNTDYEYFLFLSVPFSIIFSRGLTYMKYYWMKEVSLFLIIISLLLFKFSFLI